MVREFRPVDPNEVVGNYFAGVDRKARQGREDTVFSNQQRTQENVFADRDRKISQEGEDREYLKRRRKIEGDKDIQNEMKRLYTTIDTSADDKTYQEQISQIPDTLASRMENLGFPPEDIERTVKDMFKANAFTKPNVQRIQKSIGAGPGAPTTSTAFADLQTILGRKPTMKELREHKATGGKSGQMPSDAKMVEYLVSNKIAPDRKNAYSMVQMSKSDPVKLVSGLVSSAEEAQKAAMLSPGDDGYKDRGTLIKEAQQTVMDIRKAFTTPPEKAKVPTAAGSGLSPEEIPPAGLDELLSGGAPAAGTNQPAAGAGAEPVPQTQEDFDALPAGTLYRDPDDNKLYRK